VFLVAIVVKAQPGEHVDSLIRKFNRKVQTENLLQEIRDREHYLKPSERRQLAEAEKRRKIYRKKRLGF